MALIGTTSAFILVRVAAIVFKIGLVILPLSAVVWIWHADALATSAKHGRCKAYCYPGYS